jgi:glycogen synthase
LLNVLLLSWEYPPRLVGGLARHVKGLAHELARSGNRVTVVTSAVEGEPWRRLEAGVEVVRVRPYFQQVDDFKLWVSHLNFAMFEAGVQMLKDLDGPVIVHAHDWLTAYAARGLKHSFHIPLVATIHATEHGRNMGIHDASQQYINDVEWWLTYEAWRVIVCSASMAREVRGLFRLAADKVVVIPNGTGLPEQVRVDRAAFRSSHVAVGERLLFHIGRLVAEKGAGTLVQAFSSLVQHYDVKLVIAGVGPYQEELRRQVENLGLNDQVSFVGWISDEQAGAYYSVCDCAIVPSIYEPFGIVALEAMAAGAPLVVSDVGGLAEIVQHEVSGLKAPAGDAVALATQIGRVLSEPGLADRIAKQGQGRAREFGWDSVARKTAALYQEVLNEWSESDWGAPGGGSFAEGGNNGGRRGFEVETPDL